MSILSRRTFVIAALAGAALTLVGPACWAQVWPSRPIKIIVGYAPGGLTDLFARAYGEYLSQKLGRPVVIENRPGASGIVSAQALKASPVDGHTLLWAATPMPSTQLSRVLVGPSPCS